MKNTFPKKNTPIILFSLFVASAKRFTTVLFIFILVSGCQYVASLEDLLEDQKNDKPVTFEVRIEAVSTPNTLNSTRIDGTVPLSPGAYAVYAGANPMFTIGLPADKGIARIAEDGFPMKKVKLLEGDPHVNLSGIFESPGGPDSGPAIFSGESAMFTISAKPGDHLQLATMFVQSNDWFYAFKDRGLALFEHTAPISGDVTSALELYDAGTENDTAPGTGPTQKPVQDPMATNYGAGGTAKGVEKASERHPDFDIPPVSSVIRVTITPQQP